MTTFEIIVTVAIIAIVVILKRRSDYVKRLFQEIVLLSPIATI